MKKLAKCPETSFGWMHGLLCAGISVILLGNFGCANSRWARTRQAPFNPLAAQLELNSRQGPQPTARTLQMLRRNDLVTILDEAPEKLVSQVQEVAYAEPTADNVYSIAEVAYIAAKRIEDDQSDKALDLYATAAANAYFYLFDRSFDYGRNPYDPRFRRACDLYNNALEAALRFVQSEGMLRPGSVHTIETDEQSFDFEIAARGTWHEQNFSELKFVSDFQVEEFKNVNQRFGLGVPLVAVYQPQVQTSVDRFYPIGMSFPVTAFMRIVASKSPENDRDAVRHRCVIELHDPLRSQDVEVEGQRVPLETDLTTPLAYSLDNPIFKRANVPIRGLTDPEKSLAASGLYMLEPYDPQKIPVVMVHGFWSSLVTWMEMFNDLRGSAEIRDNYQFWFYLYPTGGPFWYSAAHFRDQLAEARQVLDPGLQAPALDQMVLVGHSMGGLISKMQTIEGGDHFWEMVSRSPFERLEANSELKHLIRKSFYFSSNPSVRRVVTIATPFRGSNFSNVATQWLGRKFINEPHMITAARKQLLSNNPGFFPDDSILNITTSVDSLATESVMLKKLDQSMTPDWIPFHNIIGVVESESRVLQALAQNSDGIVKVASAHNPHAVSEITVPSDHVNVHRHPKAILEVKRILLEHLVAMRSEQQQKDSRITWTR